VAAATCLLDGIGDIPGRRIVDIRHNDRSAFSGKQFGNSPAEPGTATGDDRDFLLKTHSQLSLKSVCRPGCPCFCE
jgi:hypothetical protein